MLTEQHIKAILTFLARVQLQGSEAPSFMTCIGALQSMLEQTDAPKPPKAIYAPEQPDSMNGPKLHDD